jgi:hypothetical protein
MEARMPRCYFDVRDGIDYRDDEGDELPDLESAKAHAQYVARELSAENTELRESELIVRDNAGECFRLTIGSGIFRHEVSPGEWSWRLVCWLRWFASNARRLTWNSTIACAVVVYHRHTRPKRRRWWQRDE